MDNADTTQEAVTLELPYPPSVNNYWKHDRYGRTRIGQEGRDYRETVLWMTKQTPQIRGYYQVLIEVYVPDRRRRDLANLDKCLMDSIEKAGIIDDDGNIDDIRFKRMNRGDPQPPGKVVVHVKTI